MGETCPDWRENRQQIAMSLAEILRLYCAQHLSKDEWFGRIHDHAYLGLREVYSAYFPLLYKVIFALENDSTDRIVRVFKLYLARQVGRRLLKGMRSERDASINEKRKVRYAKTRTKKKPSDQHFSPAQDPSPEIIRQKTCSRIQSLRPSRIIAKETSFPRVQARLLDFSPEIQESPTRRKIDSVK